MKKRKKVLVGWVEEVSWKDSFRYGNVFEDYIVFPRFDDKQEKTDIKVRITLEEI